VSDFEKEDSYFKIKRKTERGCLEKRVRDIFGKSLERELREGRL